jgi:hypothetical protein
VKNINYLKKKKYEKKYSNKLVRASLTIMQGTASLQGTANTPAYATPSPALFRAMTR